MRRTQLVKVDLDSARRFLTFRFKRGLLDRPLREGEKVEVTGGFFEGEVGPVVSETSSWEGYTYQVRRAKRPTQPRNRRRVMGLFTRKPESIVDPAEFIKRVGGLADALEKLDLSAENLALREENQRLELEAKSADEEFARKERETNHNVALIRKQIAADQEAAAKQNEADRENAVREAKLGVREEAQNAAEERAEKEIGFIRERMDKEVEAQRVLLDQILSRLPTVTVNREEYHHSSGDRALPSGEPPDVTAGS